MKKIKKPLVSIIMNCYNGEEFLEDAIQSVLTQTYKNWELVFWDNQSLTRHVWFCQQCLHLHLESE